MWGVDQSNYVVLLLIITSPRTQQMKLAFYKRLPQILNDKVNLRPEDVFISLVENQREDWSFGLGVAQLLS